ncbi:MAG: hypothetical protein HKN47_26445, partial [Pirellulaceae bacterium]|nr:hypothetical protein [Pirellulaceae bacterium]
MSGRRRKGLSPSLFPFLAVLVCTLGTLILLLALVAQNAATAAVENAEQEKALASAAAVKPPQQSEQPALTAAAVESMIAEESFRVEQLVSVRKQQAADMERRRDQLTQIESHMQRLRDELTRLNEEVEVATGESTVEAIDPTELAALRQQLQDESQQIAKLRDDMETRAPRVSLIPYKGPNGTDRRPVYLECTSEGLAIWPEGSKVSMHQLEESVSGANPLDAALRVIRHHAMQSYGDSQPPYPLLVVRPDGIECYAAARMALQDWDDQFGYELVPAEVRLAYDQPDAKLKRLVDEAIAAAVIKQHGLNALAKRASRGRGQGGSVNSSTRYPRLSAAAMDRSGRASGFGDHRDGFSQRSRYATPSSGTYGQSGYGASGADVADELDRHLREATEQLKKSDGSLSNSLGGDPLSGADASTDTVSDDASHVGDLPRQIGSGDLNAATSGQDSAIHSDPGSTAQVNQYLNPSVPQNAQLRRQDNPFSMPDQPSATTEVSSAHQNRDAAWNQTHAKPDSPESESTNVGGASDSLSDSIRQPSQSPPDSRTGASARASMSSPTNPPAGAQPPSDDQPSTASDMSPSTTKPPANLSNSRQMVRREGANWALPRDMATGGGNSIVRTIRVQCYSDRLVLVAPARGGATEMFGMTDGDMNQATLELASAVRDRIERWGAALPGGRWQPR